MWGKEIHYGKTKELAKSRSTGFSEKEAEIIAKANNGIDAIYKRNNAVWGDKSWHFNMSYTSNKGGDTRTDHYNEERRKAKEVLKKAGVPTFVNEFVIRNAFNNQLPQGKLQVLKNKVDSLTKAWHSALEYFGKGLHAFQDMYAHKEWTPEFDKKHSAYYQKLDCNGKEKELLYYGDKDRWSIFNQYFDNPNLDIELERRWISRKVPLTDKMSGVKESITLEWVWVARPGTTRIKKTVDNTRDELYLFKIENLVVSVRSLIKIYTEMRDEEQSRSNAVGPIYIKPQ